MTTTTDTGPDVQVTNATTGEIYPSQVLNEAARLDGAASDGWTPGDPWVPGPNNIPAVTALLKSMTSQPALPALAGRRGVPGAGTGTGRRFRHHRGAEQAEGPGQDRRDRC